MKKIISFLIIGLLIFSGLTCCASNGKTNSRFCLEPKEYKIKIAPITNPNSQNNLINTQILTYNINSREIPENYKPIERVNSYQIFDYVIITTEELFSSITSSLFLDWKEFIGYNVKIVNITDSEISTQSGLDLEEKIRNFLRSYYLEWGINYVLFVADHETIPMRYCYPDPTNHRFDVFDIYSGEVPTDYYYADLSSNDSDSWDMDGDGYHGEYGDDLPDFYPEVYVGRIPTAVKSKITYTLDKLVTFEQDTGDWKQNALHAGAFFWFENEDNSGNPVMDGARLSYHIEKDLMAGWNVSRYSEQEGLEISIYDWPALNETAFISDWRNGKYSIVNWQGHGWVNGVSRKVWASDDGDGVPEAPEMDWISFCNLNSNLDDDYPSIVTAESCYIGCPEHATGGNIGIDLLTDPSLGASVGVVASARSPYGSFNWPNNPGGSDQILYDFNRFMINDSKKVGEAFYDSKYNCNNLYGWNNYFEYNDMFTFNLFGDPSLKLEGISLENLPPDKPSIEGPDKGIPGTEYNYCIVATDPEDDNLYVKWDWNDGTSSDWAGPYESGTEICESHIWEEKDTYLISVTLEDEHGARVRAYKDVNIPRTKSLNEDFQWNLEKILSYFPMLQYLFYFLK
jgi:hypothetical protein